MNNKLPVGPTDLEEVDNMLPRNVSIKSAPDAASYPRETESSATPLRKP
jgi:hypothetical protein